MVSHEGRARGQLAALFAAGAAVDLCAAMGRFPEVEALQDQACGALGNLACEGDDPAAVAQVVQAGALELIAKAMQAHPSSAKVQEQACGALWNLSARNAENQARIAELGLLELVCKASKSPGGGLLRRAPRACEGVPASHIEHNGGESSRDHVTRAFGSPKPLAPFVPSACSDRVKVGVL